MEFKGSVEALIEALRDDDSSTRNAAAATLREIVTQAGYCWRILG